MSLAPKGWSTSSLEEGSHFSAASSIVHADVAQAVLLVKFVASRECHGFVNPCGLTPRVHTGMGMGWGLVTLAQPTPALRARQVLYMNVACSMGIRHCPAKYWAAMQTADLPTVQYLWR